MLRHDYDNSPLFNDITVTKYNEGKFVDGLIVYCELNRRNPLISTTAFSGLVPPT